MTPAPQPDGSLLLHLQALLLDHRDLRSTLDELARLAAAAVAGAEVGCGITAPIESQVLTVGSSDARVVRLDETQYRLDRGPCLDTLRTGDVVDLPDTGSERRWPEYVPRARELGLRCSLSLPLAFGGEVLGAMNLYGFDRPHVFGEPERHRLELFAAQASGALRIIRRLTRDARLLAQMEQALGSRTVIDQAMGIIMGRQRCPAEVAFDLLRRESQSSHRRLSEVAADLVRRTTGQEPGPARPFDPS